MFIILCETTFNNLVQEISNLLSKYSCDASIDYASLKINQATFDDTHPEACFQEVYDILTQNSRCSAGYLDSSALTANKVLNEVTEKALAHAITAKLKQNCDTDRTIAPISNFKYNSNY